MKDSNKDSAAYMKYAAAIAGQAFYSAGYNKLFADPIELGARFYFKRPMAHYGTWANAGKLKRSAPTIHAQSSDLTKLLRCIEDALTGVVWLDDKLVFKYTHDTARYWTEGLPPSSKRVRMSAIDRFMTPIDAAFLERRNLERGSRNARLDILFAMRHPDELVIEMTYTDAAGNRTRRVVSPIRNAGKKFLAMCLCRERPQWFMFVQCTDVLLRLASDYLMPIEILTLPTVET